MLPNANARDFIRFAAQSPTAFQAIREISARLEENGFRHLAEENISEIAPGGKYYFTRNQSSLIAFEISEKGFAPFQIAASHSDSPMFRLKSSFEEIVCDKYLRLNVEGYGGMLMSTWLDRPLSVAGRVVVRDGNRLRGQLVDLERDALVIPNVPIHMQRNVNDGYAWNIQKDLLPLYGGENSKGALTREIAEKLNVRPEDIVSHDLYLYCRTPGSVWGDNGMYFSSPRIDNLECAYTSLLGFLSAEDNGMTHVLAVFDNEEVGSGTRQGADSHFLSDALERVADGLGASRGELHSALAGSFMLSADNAHAVHPNHPELYDADNRTWMNGGVVIKHSANQKYTTDAVSDALFSEICRRAEIPTQHFANRSDLKGGSTLGNISGTQVSIPTVDIGLAQLAMHSAYETAGTRDLPWMAEAMKAFFSTPMKLCESEIFLGEMSRM